MKRNALYLFAAFFLLLPSYGFTTVEPALPENGFLFQEPEFLDVHEAFQLELIQETDQIRISWRIADSYYLYKERFDFSISPNAGLTLGQPQFSRKGKMKDDPAFGMVEVYYHDVEVILPAAGYKQQTMELSVSYQGCAEAGLCYPPQTKKFTLGKSAEQQSSPLKKAVPPVNAPTSDKDKTENGGISSLLQESNLLISLLTLYALGLGLAFTPCVLPMVPILSSIIAGQKKDLTTSKAFSLSLIYVLAMAATYALAGVLIGFFGAKANIQMYLQTPSVLISFALLFVLLSFSMFGFYEIQLPGFLRDRFERLNQKQKGGNFIGVAIMGALSALVVSPCVSAPLIGVLTYISSTGDAVLGGLALFSLGMGMGSPLIIIGAGGGKLIPKAGGWMDTCKAVFGVLLLAVAVWMLERILPGPVTLVLWAMLLITSAIYMNALDAVSSGWQKLWKGLAVVMLVYGTLLLIGAASGQSNPLKPIQLSQVTHSETAPASETLFQPVQNLDELSAALASAKRQGRSVMLDFYADWCISCKIMERQTFSDAGVQAELARTLLLQADISKLSPEGQAMLDHFGLFGLPSILFWSPDGTEQSSARVQGEMNAQQFREHLSNKVIL